MQCLNQTVALSFVTGPQTVGRPAELQIATGNMDDTLPLEVVVALEYRNTNTPTQGQAPSKVQLMVFSCQDSTCTSLYFIGKHCYHGPGYIIDAGGGLTELTQSTYVPSNIALSVGNLYGRGLRVSQPQHWTFEGVPKLIAVIGAPPTHLDYFAGLPLVVNGNTAAGNSYFAPFIFLSLNITY